jgi:hypothetical protein
MKISMADVQPKLEIFGKQALGTCRHCQKRFWLLKRGGYPSRGGFLHRHDPKGHFHSQTCYVIYFSAIAARLT